MLHELEKPAVPHSMGAREVAKHPAGWRSAAGGAERCISFPATITSPKSFKMFVLKKKTAFFFLHFFCRPLVQNRESFMFLPKEEEKKIDDICCLKRHRDGKLIFLTGPP